VERARRSAGLRSAREPSAPARPLRAPAREPVAAKRAHFKVTQRSLRAKRTKDTPSSGAEFRESATRTKRRIADRRWAEAGRCDGVSHRLRPFQSAILHSVSPPTFAHGETPWLSARWEDVEAALSAGRAACGPGRRHVAKARQSRLYTSLSHDHYLREMALTHPPHAKNPPVSGAHAHRPAGLDSGLARGSHRATV